MASERQGKPGGITRRNVTIHLGTYFLALQSRSLWAQDLNSQYALITPLFNNALAVGQFALEIPLSDINANIPKYLDMDYFDRQNTLNVANQLEIFNNADSAIKYVRSIPNILPKEFPLTYDITAQDSQIAVINALVKQSLPIVPKAESVTRVNIPSILPQNGTIDTDIIVLGP